MPWLTIIMTLLSFFLSKKSGASDTQALLTAGLVGGATYYTTRNTEWGRTNLGEFDGVVTPGPIEAGQMGAGPAIDGGTANGGAITPGVSLGGTPVNVNPGATGINGANGGSFWDIFKDWGIGGAIAGVGVAATAKSLLSNPLVLGGIILLAYAVISK